jgi:hypothetical protein
MKDASQNFKNLTNAHLMILNLQDRIYSMGIALEGGTRKPSKPKMLLPA